MSERHESTVKQDPVFVAATWFLIFAIIAIFVLGVVLVIKGVIEAASLIILSVAMGFAFRDTFKRIIVGD